MATYFNNFTNITSYTNIDNSEYLIGFRNTSNGGERRTTMDAVADYATNKVNALNSSVASKLISPQINEISMSGNKISNSSNVIKAWVVFNGFGTANTSLTIKESYNVSSVTKVSTSNYKLTFSNAYLNDTFYGYAGSSIGAGIYGVNLDGAYNGDPTNKKTDEATFRWFASGAGSPAKLYDCTEISIVIFGN